MCTVSAILLQIISSEVQMLALLECKVYNSSVGVFSGEYDV